jgi:plasmid stabilization system protein ParE
MAYQIIWTAEADKDFYSIIHYLKENWSDYSAQKFAERIMKKLERIATMPYEPRFTSQPNIQIIKLDRKNVPFFTIKNNDMALLSIYPYKKDISKK